MSFSCAKSTLIVLNLFYVMVAFILIGVGTYGRTSNAVTSLEIVGGIVASGIFLLFVSVAGLYGTIKHQQVTLFIYMIVIFAIFIVQFSVSCACLAVSKDKQIDIAKKAWGAASDDVKFTAESLFGCCGFMNSTDGVKCDQVPSCHRQRDGSYDCQTCFSKIQDKIGHAFSLAGGVGLFFAFTEFFAILHAHRFRRENAHYVS